MINQVSLPEAKSVWEKAFQENDVRVPFLSWQWHGNWQEIFGSSHQPLYLVVDNAVVAPFVKNNDAVTFSGGEEIADYLDLIGPTSMKEGAWPQVLEFLVGQGIKQLSLRNVPGNSPTVAFFQKQPNAIVKQEDTTPTMSLPSTWEEFIESIPSRKYRHELERKVRKFEREHSDAKVTVSNNPGEDIRILLDLMEKDAEKKSFLTPQMKTMFQKTASTFTDSISLLLLKMGDKYASATLSFVSEGTSYLYNSGFDKACCPNSGFYLKSMSIKHAIEMGYKTYNFLQGSERYKYELGGKDFFVYSIQYHL